MLEDSGEPNTPSPHQYHNLHPKCEYLAGVVFDQYKSCKRLTNSNASCILEAAHQVTALVERDKYHKVAQQQR
jgi:hypothetical protein